MAQEGSVTAIAHAIQLAVAPVFLVSGIAAFLAVLTNRLGRIIDRARALGASAASPSSAETQQELHVLTRRARLVNRSIALATSSALLIATLIVILFVGAFLTLDVAPPVGILFVAALLALIGALLAFLQEVRLATSTLRLHDGQRSDSGRAG